MSRVSTSMLFLQIVLAGASLILIGTPFAQAASPLKADFNGDGYEDLAIGAPYEDISGIADAGLVHVVYGSSGGITTFRNQLIRQGAAGVPDQAEAWDNFGYSLAAGDFNADGYADLAIGALGEDLGSTVNAGIVIVLRGTAGGVTGVGTFSLYQGYQCAFASIEGQAGTNDRFGWALTAGDFNGDNYDDLAIGVPGETADAGNVPSAGVVNVLYGGSSGLNCWNNQLWYQGSPGIQESPEANDYFGVSLATADFDADSCDDLAIGVPDEYVSGVPKSGAVNVILGAASGLVDAGDQLWHQDVAGILGIGEPDDRFGYSLATGHFNGDVYADLAIGIPEDNVSGLDAAGSVTVLHGSGAALTANGNQLWNQASLGISMHELEGFGLSLAAGNFGQGGWDDLAIGVYFDRLTGIYAGSVNLIFGSWSGLTAGGAQLWHQDSPGIDGFAESHDYFGFMVTAGDFNGDGYADLACAAPGEDWSVSDAGVVHVLKASAVGTGLISSGSLVLDQSMIQDSRETGDFFGWALGR